MIFVTVINASLPAASRFSLNSGLMKTVKVELTFERDDGSRTSMMTAEELGYSHRSAMIGSTRAARRAGR